MRLPNLTHMTPIFTVHVVGLYEYTFLYMSRDVVKTEVSLVR